MLSLSTSKSVAAALCTQLTICYTNGTAKAASGAWPAENTLFPIYELEAEALLRGLEALVPKGSSVHVLIDNTTVFHSLQKKRSSVFHLNKRIQASRTQWTFLSITWIPSARNAADYLSRHPQTKANYPSDLANTRHLDWKTSTK